MSTNVRSTVPADSMDWKLTTKKSRVDTATGTVTSDSKAERSGASGTDASRGVRDALRAVNSDRDVRAIRPETVTRQIGEGKLPVTQGRTERAESEQQARFQDVKASARAFGDLARGSTAVKPSDGGRQGAFGGQDLGGRQLPQQGAAGITTRLPDGQTRQGISTVTTTFGAISAGVQAVRPETANTVPKASSLAQVLREPSDRTKTASNEGVSGKTAASEAGVNTTTMQSGNAAAAMARQGAEKTEQPFNEIADNNNDKEEGEKESREPSASTRSQAASRQLGGLISGLGQGGLGSSTTSDGDAGFEVVADAVDRTRDGEENGPAKKVGLTFYNIEEGDAKVMVAAREYGKMEQMLEVRLPLEKKVENWTDRDLQARVLVIKEEIRVAQLLIDRLRSTSGRGAPNGYGMSA